MLEVGQSFPRSASVWGKVGAFAVLGPLEKNMGVSTHFIAALLLLGPHVVRPPHVVRQASHLDSPFHSINK